MYWVMGGACHPDYEAGRQLSRPDEGYVLAPVLFAKVHEYDGVCSRHIRFEWRRVGLDLEPAVARRAV